MQDKIHSTKEESIEDDLIYVKDGLIYGIIEDDSIFELVESEERLKEYFRKEGYSEEEINEICGNTK